MALLNPGTAVPGTSGRVRGHWEKGKLWVTRLWGRFPLTGWWERMHVSLCVHGVR